MISPANLSFGRILALQAGSVEANSLFECLVGQFHAAAAETRVPGLVAGLSEAVSSATGVHDLWDWLKSSPLARAFRTEASGPNLLDVFFSDLEQKKSRGVLAFLTGAPLYGLGRNFLASTLFEALQDPVYGSELREALGAAGASPAPLLLYHRIFHLILSREHFYKVREIVPLGWNRADRGFETAFVSGRCLGLALRSLTQACATLDAARLEEGRTLWREKVDSVRDLLHRPPVAWFPRLLSLPPTTRQAQKLAEDIAAGAKEVRFASEDELTRQAMKKKNRAAGALPLVRIEALHLTAEENGERPAILLKAPARSDTKSWKDGQVRDAAANSVHEDIHIEQPLREEEPLSPMRDFLPCEEEAHAGEALFRCLNGDDSYCRLAISLSPYGYAMGLRNWIEHVYLRQLAVPSAP